MRYKALTGKYKNVKFISGWGTKFKKNEVKLVLDWTKYVVIWLKITKWLFHPANWIDSSLINTTRFVTSLESSYKTLCSEDVCVLGQRLKAFHTDFKNITVKGIATI